MPYIDIVDSKQRNDFERVFKMQVCNDDGSAATDLVNNIVVERFGRPRIYRGMLRDAPVSDPLGGLRVYRGIVLKKALRDRPESDPLITTDGWAANVELLGRLAPHARRIAEVGLRVVQIPHRC